MNDFFQLGVTEGIAHLQLDHPERMNTMTPGFFPLLRDAVQALLEHAMSASKSIAAKSPLAVAGSKLALNHARDHGTAAALAQMTLLQSAIFDTAEMAEAIAAWKERRSGSFAPLAAARQV